MDLQTKYDAIYDAVRLLEEVRTGLISLEIYPAENGIEISSIWSERERGRGHASSVMRALIDLADEYEVDLLAQPHWLRYETEYVDMDKEEADILDALNLQRLDNEQLLDWYRRLGFELMGVWAGDDPVVVRRAREPALHMVV